jgi:hypothetical protein
MDQISRHEEQDLIGAVEQAIRLTHDDMSPTDAIMKIASDRQFGPEKIKRMAEAFNKSKSVHVFKTAGEEDRAQPFELANADTVIQKIFSPEQKVASGFQLPEGDFTTIDFNFVDDFQKSAKEGGEEPLHISETDLKTIDRMAKQAKIEHAQFCDGMQEQLRMKVQEHKYDFEVTLDKIASYMQPLPDSAVQKIAQYVVNGYPTSGKGLLSLLANRSRREIPILEKTANAIVFQTREPYLSISQLYTSAEKMAAAEIEFDMFEKKSAEPFMSSIAANTIANMLGGMGLNPEEMSKVMGSKKKSVSVEEDLDPTFYNRLKSHDAKRTFMTLALYDPDLKGYKQADLMRSYNSSVGSVPEAYNKPEILKNLMIRNLQSSGIKDPFELKQEAEISKALRESATAQEQKVLQEKVMLEARKEREKPVPGVMPIGPSKTIASLKGLMDPVGKMVDEGRKETRTRAQKIEDERRKEGRKAGQEAAKREASAPSQADLTKQKVEGLMKKWKPSMGTPYFEIEDALTQHLTDPSLLLPGQLNALSQAGFTP